MRVALLKISPSNCCNGCVPVDESSGLIAFPRNFAISFHRKMSKRAILAAKNKDVDDLNFVIQNQIIGTLHSFKSIDCVTNEDKSPTIHLNF